MTTINKIERKSEKAEEKSQNGISRIEDKKKGMETILDSELDALNKSLKLNIDLAEETLKKVNDLPEIKAFFDKSKNPSDKEIKAFVMEQLPGIIKNNEEIFNKMESEQVEREQKKMDRKLKPVNQVIERLGKKNVLKEGEREELEKARLEKDKIAQEFKKSMENLHETSPELKAAKKQMDILKSMNEQIERIRSVVSDAYMVSKVQAALMIDGPLIKEINKAIKEDVTEPFEEYIRSHSSHNLSDIKDFMKGQLKNAVKSYKWSNAALKDLGILKIVNHADDYKEYFGKAASGKMFDYQANSRQKKLDGAIRNVYDDVKLADKDISSSKFYSAIKYYAVAYAEAKLVNMSLKGAGTVAEVTNNMHAALKSKDFMLLKPANAKSGAKKKAAEEAKAKQAEPSAKQMSSEAASAELSKQVSITWLAGYESYLKENEWAKETAKRIYAEYPGLEKKFKLNQMTVGEAMVLWKGLMLERKRLMNIPEDDKEAYTSADIVNAKTTDDAKRIWMKDIAYVSIKKVGVENLKANGYTDDSISTLSSILKTSTRLIKLEEHEIELMHRKLEELLRSVNGARKVTALPIGVPSAEKVAIEGSNAAGKVQGLEKTPAPLKAPHS